MAQKISVIGTGYVGLVSAVGLADFGNSVIGVDIDEKKVVTLSDGKSTIYEPGIEEYLQRNLRSGRLRFVSDVFYAIRESDIILIAVGTPPKDDGSTDLSQVEAVIDAICKNLSSFKVIVTKSTVPVGTNRWINDEISKRTGSNNFTVVSNPEFLREGRAVYDFFHPDRVVIGYEDSKAREIMEDVYRALYLIQTPFIWCGLETAELIKYASNAFLATKITFINQIANLAEAVGADVHTVAKTMGMDGRISPKFLHPGPGYGGSCFPKDTKAIAHIGDNWGVDMSLIKEVIHANENQKIRMVEKINKEAGDLKERKVAVLGLAFKAETDDVRESPAITIVKCLLQKGALVYVHDPKALENFRKLFGNRIAYSDSEYSITEGADILCILTEWNQYRNLNLSVIRKAMRGNHIFDFRNVLDIDAVVKNGFIYSGVGRRPT